MALEPADHLHQRSQEARALRARQLKSSPALRHPDHVAADDQLEAEEHRDDLEDVREAAGRERERRRAEQQHEQDREALLPEEVHQAVDRLVALGGQPALEVVTEPHDDPPRRRTLRPTVLMYIDTHERRPLPSPDEPWRP